MESDQIEVYRPSPVDPSNNDKENVVLRALVGNPDRHKPLVEHRPPSTLSNQEKSPATMYTLETRHRPIPRKVLPTPIEPNILYHIDANRAGETTPPLMRQESETPLIVQQNEPKILEEEEEEEARVTGPRLENEVISTPILYTIVANKRSATTHDPVSNTNGTTSQSVKPTVEKTPFLYSLVANPRLPTQIPQEIKPEIQPPVQTIPQATLYTIIGNPDLSAAAVRPPPNILKPVRPPPPTPVKRRTEETAMYVLIGGPTYPKKKTVRRRTKSFDSETSKLPPAPTLYPLVSEPRSPGSDKIHRRQKRVTRRKSPSTTDSNVRASRSVDGKRSSDGTNSMPPIKNKRQARSKEPSIPKSETVFIPLRDEERSPRVKKARTTLWDSPENRHRSPYLTNRYDPLALPNYQSPYAYHPGRGRQGRKAKTHTLPPLKDHRSAGKPRARMYTPRYRDDQMRPSEFQTHHSLERNSTNRRPRLWDYEHQAQTDIDDSDGDDDNEENKFSQKQQGRRRRRPRTPWVPVW